LQLVSTTRIKLTIASNRPSVRSVFPSERKEEKKTRSGFSTYSNSTATPSKGKEKGKGRESEVTIKGSEREKEKEGSWGRKRGKRTPLLIKHLGGVERRKGESDVLNYPILHLQSTLHIPVLYNPASTAFSVYSDSPIHLFTYPQTSVFHNPPFLSRVSGAYADLQLLER